LSGLGQIAFKNDDGWYWVISADGSDIYKLPDPIGNGHYSYGDDCHRAAWSPTGSQLAVISDGNIFVLSADGSNAQKITDRSHTDYCIDWSPDGQYLAFSSDRADVIERGVAYTDIFIIHPDGTGLKKITSSDKFCIRVDWSPTGEWLVFDCMRDGANIYLSSRDGSRLWQLTSDSTSRNPSWSPDGNSIAFEGRGGGDDYNKYNIYVMDSNGANIRQLTNNDRSFHPVWSPDGRSITFMYAPDDGDLEFRAMDADGNHKRLLAKGIDYTSLPSWSPDSRYITYGIGSDLYVLDVISGNISGLVAGYEPIWSPLAIQRLDDCTSGWTRLEAGAQARVMGAAGDPPNRVRAQPSQAGETIGQIQPGTILTLLEGPVCSGGLVFWKVASDLIPGGSGWTAEGDGKEYWLEPYSP